MSTSQHSWVIEDLLDLVSYAELHGLSEIRDQCHLAYEAALQEVGSITSISDRLEKKHQFVDAIRGLIDYADNSNLTKTRNLLILALSSAADHLDGKAASHVILEFPRRSAGESSV